MDEDPYNGREHGEPEADPVRPIAITEQAVYLFAALGATLIALAFICSVTVIGLWGKWQPW